MMMLDAFERRRHVPRSFQGRISIDSADRGYAAHNDLLSDGYKISIFLDDVQVQFCISADPNEGSITRLKTVHGRVVYLAGIAQIETIKGRVCIKLEPKAKSCS